MEVIIAAVVIGGIIWFGLATIASRKDANGMDAQDRYVHRKAMESTMKREAAEMGHLAALDSIAFAKNEQRLEDEGLTAEQAKDVSRSRVDRHREEGHQRPRWECAACDAAEPGDVAKYRQFSDDPEQMLQFLEESERALAQSGIVRRPGAKSNREMIEDVREQMGLNRSWSGESRQAD